MITKLFEVRDRGTFLPVVATKCQPQNVAERYLLSRTGYGLEEQGDYVIFHCLNCQGAVNHDAYEWGDRTMATAHQYISEHFDELETGDVVDVRVILGEQRSAVVSERFLGVL